MRWTMLAALALAIISTTPAPAQEVDAPPLMTHKQERDAARARAAEFLAAFDQVAADLTDAYTGSACGFRSLEWWHTQRDAIVARASVLAHARMHLRLAADAYVHATEAAAHLAAIRALTDFKDAPCLVLITERRLEKLEARARGN